MARPTKYDPAYHPEHAYKLAMLSHTDEEMADFFGIEPSTFYLWKQKHPEFSEAVTRGKIPADADVALSFHKRACGYEYEGEKIFCCEGEVVRARTTVHVPPDAGAALNWLKNRQPQKWRDKRALEMETEEGEAIAIPVVRVRSSQAPGA
ncbi:helix-turn-helix domain-containing protein [Microvirga arabica]|uniref:Helix-turn-helix domain-containing protein n=1 Tax=Microvirga arabica TaxID=1128671 RepID=A0ABV6YES9_9HYPH